MHALLHNHNKYFSNMLEELLVNALIKYAFVIFILLFVEPVYIFNKYDIYI